MEGIGGGRATRYFGDSARTGRVLGEEGRAAENVYIQVTACSAATSLLQYSIFHTPMKQSPLGD
jgi:hypothetical protein